MERAKVKRWVKRAVVLLVAVYLGLQFWNIEWESLAENWHAFNPIDLVFAFLVFFVGLFYLAFGWHLILWQMGGKLPFRRGLYIWIASQLGRFVPGKVVLVLGRAHMCKKEGVEKRISSASVIYEMAFMTLAAFILFVTAIGLGPEPDSRAAVAPLLVIIRSVWPLVFLGVLMIHPRLFYGLINRLLAKVGKKPLAKDFRFLASLRVLLYYIGFWALLGLGFFFVIRSVDPEAQLAQLFPMAGIYAGACSAGFLVIVVPDGMGIREGFMKNLLLATGLVASEKHPFLIGIMVRGVSLLSELLGFLIVRAMTDTQRYRTPAPADAAEEAEAAP